VYSHVINECFTFGGPRFSITATDGVAHSRAPRLPSDPVQHRSDTATISIQQSLPAPELSGIAANFQPDLVSLNG
jgi:hypothetical protein